MILQGMISNQKILTKTIEKIMILSLKKISISLIVAFLSCNLSCAQEYNYSIIKIIDGDTIEFQADFLPAPLKPTLYLRINGVDTPEIHQPKCRQEKILGELAKNYTENIIKNTKSYKIIITNWDKFGGRVDGDVITQFGNLSNLLINNKFAKIYNGTKKQSWCTNQ